MTEPIPVIAVKGFDSDLKCRGFQFEVGETYTHDGPVAACHSGFHACENPLDVFGYYKPGVSRFCTVELSGQFSRHEDDSKIAAAQIKLVAELSIPEVVTAAVKWIMSAIDRTIAQTNTGNSSAATNTGYSSAATNTGDRSAATNTGNRSAATNTGNRSAATNTGDSSAATNTGNRSAATNTGNSSAATNTGYSSAATNTGDRSAATNTGDRSAATNTGYSSAATNTGNRSAATVEGKQSVAIATGYKSRAKACEGSAIVICYRDENWNLIHVFASLVGQNGIKPDVFYSLDAAGKPFECEAFNE